MRKFLLFFCFFSLSIHAQDDLQEIINQNRFQIEKVDTSALFNAIVIPSEFAKNNLFKKSVKNQLSEITIVHAYYVYTQYKLNPNFNQKQLDLERFKNLKQNLPSLFDNVIFSWEIIEQTGCKDFKEGKDYFHGFIIVHRPYNTIENAADEFNRLNNYFVDPNGEFVQPEIDPIKKLYKVDSDPEKNNIENTPANYADGDYALYMYFKLNIDGNSEIGYSRYDKWVDVKFTVLDNGKVDSLIFEDAYPIYVKSQIKTLFEEMPDWKPAIRNGINTTETIDMSIRVSYSGNVKGMYTINGKKPNFEDQKYNPAFENNEAELTPISNDGFNPNSAETYQSLELFLKGKENVALVMDVTGSMAQYIASLTKWVLDNHSSHPFTSFTFFNDGDGKPTKKKKIGETGGVYFSKPEDGDIREAIKNAMVNGSGGERPENDIEAVLKAQDKDEKATEIMLCGDNYSEVRDLELLDDVELKVNVLICGSNSIPRTDYIKIAWKTGGVLIYKHKVYTFDLLSERETYQVGEYHYKFDGEDFRRVK